MIYTITLNPALDHYMIVDKPLINDEVNRTSYDYFKVGGKGLNASKSLELLGIKNIAIALIGGFTGKFIKDEFSNRELINFIGIEIEGNTRVNAKIYAQDKTICVNAGGSSANENTKSEIYKQLKSLNKNDIVMICGKACPGLDDEYLVQLSSFIHDKEATLVIDMESLNVEMIEKCKPDLIKPNQYELEMILNNYKDSIEEKSKKLLDIGLSSILVSRGKDGAYYSNKKECYQITQPTIEAVNKVGCGDAMLATFIGILEQSKDLEKALAYSVAAGCAVASKLEDITLEDIQKYLKDIHVSKKQFDIE